MKGLKRGLAGVLSIALLMAGMSFSAKASIEDYDYEIVDGGVCITGYYGEETDVVVPAEIDGYPVVAIGDDAFYACLDILSIKLPDTVTEIGSYAFATCWSLTDIFLPDNVTSIGEAAFEYCLDLVSVDLPSGITEIPDNMFTMCGSLKEVNIPDGVTSIGAYAFEYCNVLESVTIPDSVTSIGTDAFVNCYSLLSVEIPASVTMIEDYAFGYVKNPSGVHDSNGIEIIGVKGSAAQAYAEENEFFFTEKSTVVTPCQVTGVQAVYDNGQIRLTWDDCGAVQYKVSRSDGRGGYTNLTYRATADGWVDSKDLIPAQLYYYRITAYFKDAEGQLVQGEASEAAVVVATDSTPEKVTGVTASVQNKKVTLNWNTADSARYYKVSRASGATGQYYTMKYNIEETSYTDASLPAGTYRYKVVGYYKDVDGGWVYGDLCDTLYVTVK